MRRGSEETMRQIARPLGATFGRPEPLAVTGGALRHCGRTSPAPGSRLPAHAQTGRGFEAPMIPGHRRRDLDRARLPRYRQGSLRERPFQPRPGRSRQLLGRRRARPRLDRGDAKVRAKAAKPHASMGSENRGEARPLCAHGRRGSAEGGGTTPSCARRSQRGELPSP